MLLCGASVAEKILTGVDYRSVSENPRKKGEDARWFVGRGRSVTDDLNAETLNAHDGDLVRIFASQLRVLDHAVEDEMSVRHCVGTIEDNARKCTVPRLTARCDLSGEDLSEIRRDEQRHGERRTR